MATIDPVVAKALQSQMTYERYSAAVYEAFGAELDARNMVGMSQWMYRQAGEEQSHSVKIRSYLADCNITPLLQALDQPAVPASEGLLGIGAALFGAALAHERTVTERIGTCFQLARRVGDSASEVFLQWFVSEQVEEEKTLEEIMTRFALAEGNGAAILMIDQALGGR